MLELLKYQTYRPNTAVWELTLACNMRCQHCGSRAGAPRERELSWEEAQRVADELLALGLQRITLSGGEPTLCEYWDKLGKRFRDGGAAVNIISNGWTWTPELLQRAKAAKLNSVAFSLDGLETVHDRIRRAGSFERIMRALDGCKASGMPTGVITHINRPNRGSLREMHQLLTDRGVRIWQLQLGNPAGEMCEHSELVIAPQDLLELVPLFAQLRRESDPNMVVCVGDNIGYYGKYESELRREPEDDPDIPAFWFGCTAGCMVVGIESNGNVKGCLSLPSARHGHDAFVEGNVRHASLSEIWNRPGAFAYNRCFEPSQLKGFCASCRHRQVCRGGCAWTAQSHTGSRFENPYCFYRQALEHGRTDLLGDEDGMDRDIQLFKRAVMELTEEAAAEGSSAKDSKISS